MASAVRRPRDLAVGGHRDEGDLAAAGGVDQLEGHLDAVAVGLVEDELPVALERLGGGIQRTRVGRVRDLLHADDDVHGATVCAASRVVTGQILGAWYGRPLTVKVLLRRQLRRPRRSPPAAGSSSRRRSRPTTTSTVAETSRRGHATRLAQGAAADGTDVVVVLGGDGTLNEAANGLAGTDTALAAAARRLDQRVRPHPRPARRPDRGHRRAARRARRAARSAGSASAR